MRSERINTISRLVNAKRYLEIGVCRGDTFFEVETEYKVGVDPCFQFNFKAKENKNTRFYQVPSDDFFRLSRREKFDVIYLDGLHTFEQTLRDFINSLEFSHEKSIWLIDDTRPNDNFAALPDEDRCFRLRRLLGNGDWAWMGDVYKIVYFIRNVMNFYNYRTFSGHGQTVVWKDATTFGEGPSVPLEKVGSMTYEDHIGTLQSMMNIEPDAKIYADIEAFFSK